MQSVARPGIHPARDPVRVEYRGAARCGRRWCRVHSSRIGCHLGPRGRVSCRVTTHLGPRCRRGLGCRRGGGRRARGDRLDPGELAARSRTQPMGGLRARRRRRGGDRWTVAGRRVVGLWRDRGQHSSPWNNRPSRHARKSVPGTRGGDQWRCPRARLGRVQGRRALLRWRLRDHPDDAARRR